MLGGQARPHRIIHIFRVYFIELLIQQFRMPPNTGSNAPARAAHPSLPAVAVIKLSPCEILSTVAVHQPRRVTSLAQALIEPGLAASSCPGSGTLHRLQQTHAACLPA